MNVPQKGTFIREFTKKYIEENFPIKAVLEGLALRLAISYLGTEDILLLDNLNRYIQFLESKNEN